MISFMVVYFFFCNWNALLLVQQYPPRQVADKSECHHEERVSDDSSNGVMLGSSLHHNRERCRDPMPSEASSRHRN